jgi:hypothetical protein
MATKPFGYWLHNPEIEEITGSHFEKISPEELAGLLMYCAAHVTTNPTVQGQSLRAATATSRLDRSELIALMKAILDHLQ